MAHTPDSIVHELTFPQNVLGFANSAVAARQSPQKLIEMILLFAAV